MSKNQQKTLVLIAISLVMFITWRSVQIGEIEKMIKIHMILGTVCFGCLTYYGVKMSRINKNKSK